MRHELGPEHGPQRVGEIATAEQAPGVFSEQHNAQLSAAVERGAEQLAARVAVMEAAMQTAANDAMGDPEQGRAAWEAVAEQRAA